MAPKRSLAAPTTLSPRGHDHQLHVVIETPKGTDPTATDARMLARLRGYVLRG